MSVLEKKKNENKLNAQQIGKEFSHLMNYSLYFHTFSLMCALPRLSAAGLPINGAHSYAMHKDTQ